MHKGSSASKKEASLSSPDFTLSAIEAAQLSAKINDLVCKRFLNQKMVDEIWKPSYAAARAELAKKTDLLSFAKSINELLAKLHTSHTQLLTENDEAFYFMRCLFGSFNKDPKAPHKNDGDFVGLGVGGAQAEANQVRYVLDGSPAASSGVRRGDKILSVNGKPYTGYSAWYHQSGKPCSLRLERQVARFTVTVTPVKQDFMKGYVTATEKSARIIEHQGKKIGYLHYWSGGEGAPEVLEDTVCSKFKNTDALVLDFRDGYGGASMDNMDLFFRPRAAYPDTVSTTREGSHSERMTYDKPVALLINKGVRSGKEMLAYGLKRSKRARLFGEHTAGYVVAGQFNPLSKRVILYLGVSDIKLDGERLEGVGVYPDQEVEDKLVSDDPVLQAALDYLCRPAN